MKTKLLIISISVIFTTIIILLIEYFIFGLNSKPKTVMSLDSPNGLYNAYVIENPSIDPPNQGLFISKNGSNEFRLVGDLPEDIEAVYKIYWMPDSRIVVFATNWHLIITNVEKFNTKKISLNPDWWKWHGNKGTFSSSNRIVEIKQLDFDSDSLRYLTNKMAHPEKICLNDL